MVFAIFEQTVDISLSQLVEQAGATRARASDAFGVKQIDPERVVSILVARPPNQLNHTFDGQSGDQCIDDLDHSNFESQTGAGGAVDLAGCRHAVLNHVQGVQEDRERVPPERFASSIVGTSNKDERVCALDGAVLSIARGGFVIRPEVVARNLTDRRVLTALGIEHPLRLRARTIGPLIEALARRGVDAGESFAFERRDPFRDVLAITIVQPAQAIVFGKRLAAMPRRLGVRHVPGLVENRKRVRGEQIPQPAQLRDVPGGAHVPGNNRAHRLKDRVRDVAMMIHRQSDHGFFHDLVGEHNAEEERVLARVLPFHNVDQAVRLNGEVAVDRQELLAEHLRLEENGKLRGGVRGRVREDRCDSIRVDRAFYGVKNLGLHINSFRRGFPDDVRAGEIGIALCANRARFERLGVLLTKTPSFHLPRPTFAQSLFCPVQRLTVHIKENDLILGLPEKIRSDPQPHRARANDGDPANFVDPPDSRIEALIAK